MQARNQGVGVRAIAPPPIFSVVRYNNKLNHFATQKYQLVAVLSMSIERTPFTAKNQTLRSYRVHISPTTSTLSALIQINDSYQIYKRHRQKTSKAEARHSLQQPGGLSQSGQAEEDIAWAQEKVLRDDDETVAGPYKPGHHERQGLVQAQFFHRPGQVRHAGEYQTLQCTSINYFSCVCKRWIGF